MPQLISPTQPEVEKMMPLLSSSGSIVQTLPLS